MRALLLVLAAATAAHADPLPPIASVAKLELQQGQGGPAIMRCNGVVYTLAIDLANNAWTHAVCPYDDKKPDKLVSRTGKLTADERTKLEAEYATLVAGTDRRCGNDGGTLALVVTRTDGTTARYVDTNWGCKKPPPVSVEKLPAFANTLRMMKSLLP